MLTVMLMLLTATPPADSVIGTWKGQLVLDNSAPKFAFVFARDSASEAHTTLTVLWDGQEFGPVSELVVEGTTVTFRIQEFGFVGVLSGDRLTFSIDNGRGKTFTLVMRRRLSDP